MERKTKYVILGLLTEKPLSGYDIKKCIGIRFNYFWSESFGQIYPELESLVKEGLIVKEMAPASGKRKRYSYRITENGNTTLRDWLKKPVETEINRYEILLKTYFGNLSDRAILIRHIREFQSRHKQDLTMLNLFNEEISGIPDRDGNHDYVLLTIRFGQKVYEAYLDWCELALSYLKKK